MLVKFSCGLISQQGEETEIFELPDDTSEEYLEELVENWANEQFNYWHEVVEEEEDEEEEES